MTPKEKAEELFEKMYNVDDPIGNYPMCYETSRQCALIAVDEIINEYNRLESYKFIIEKEYWQEVKTEIEKL